MCWVYDWKNDLIWFPIKQKSVWGGIFASSQHNIKAANIEVSHHRGGNTYCSVCCCGPLETPWYALVISWLQANKVKTSLKNWDDRMIRRLQNCWGQTEVPEYWKVKLYLFQL